MPLCPHRLLGGADTEHAQAAVEEWQSRQDGVYTAVSRREAVHNGQGCTVASYQCGSETNPYSRGVSVFGVCGKYAASMELNCRESFGGCWGRPSCSCATSRSSCSSHRGRCC